MIYVLYPRVNCLKTIPLTAAHTYIYPPPGGLSITNPCLQQILSGLVASKVEAVVVRVIAKATKGPLVINYGTFVGRGHISSYSRCGNMRFRLSGNKRCCVGKSGPRLVFLPREALDQSGTNCSDLFRCRWGFFSDLTRMKLLYPRPCFILCSREWRCGPTSVLPMGMPLSLNTQALVVTLSELGEQICFPFYSASSLIVCFLVPFWF